MTIRLSGIITKNFKEHNYKEICITLLKTNSPK